MFMVYPVENALIAYWYLAFQGVSSKVLVTIPVLPTVLYPPHLKSFQMTKLKTYPPDTQLLIQSQWTLKAQPYSTASLEAMVSATTTFQDGSQKWFRQLTKSQTEETGSNAVLAPLAGKPSQLFWMQDMIFVMLSEVMFPVPCHLTPFAATRRVSSVTAKRNLFWQAEVIQLIIITSTQCPPVLRIRKQEFSFLFYLAVPEASIVRERQKQSELASSAQLLSRCRSFQS